jgi:hypothetical protein
MAGIENFRAANTDECEEIKVGDFVRSYDFETHDDIFVVGRVQEVGVEMEGCPRYRIASLRGDGREVYPPVNGTAHSFGGYCNGVRKCEGEELAYFTERWADWASDVEVY